MADEDPKSATPSIVLPPSLARLTTPGGVHRRGRKIAMAGEAGSGKSYFCSCVPRPALFIDSKELGLQPYLQADDHCLQIDNPDDYYKAIDFACKNEKLFNSVVVDPISLMWENWMDNWTERLNGEIKGGDWRKVKSPWKEIHHRALYARWNFVVTAHIGEVIYEAIPGAPGESDKLNIKPGIVMKLEKSLPYLFDFIFYTENVKDARNKPTGDKKYTIFKCRRPRSIPPTELFTGRSWVFNDKKPLNVWDRIIRPFDEHWMEGSVEHLGGDPEAEQRDGREAEQAANLHELGRIMLIIEEAKSLKSYADKWRTEIAPVVNTLPLEMQSAIKEAHAKKKALLMAAEGRSNG